MDTTYEGYEPMEGKENDIKGEILEYYQRLNPKDFTKKDIRSINEIFENWNKLNIYKGGISEYKQ
ncbi:hypothetical protein [Psychrilyobacter sp.]|uniref:hypothetical protein n=1 Tax=Psychrilyobacter sp. TaxID=2586924 RepID=UPI003015E5E2